MKNSSELIPIKEKHFNLFLESLLLFSEDKERSCKKLFEAYEEAGKCSLCVSCAGCAKSFYRQIVTLLFNSIELRGSFD